LSDTADIDRLPSIGTLSLRWILFAALAGVAIQLAWCLHENLGDEQYFTHNFILGEADRLLAGASLRDGRFAAVNEGKLEAYRGKDDGAYGFRIFDEGFQILQQVNGAQIAAVSPLNAGQALPDSWQRKTGPGWFEVVGGVKRQVGTQNVWVEVMTRGDPDHRRINTLVSEIIADVWTPLAPTVALTMLVGMLGVGRMLHPLKEAAKRARQVEGEMELVPFAVKGLPREAALFTNAINRLLTRVAALLKSHELMTACVAHELRSRLAILLLEVNKLPAGAARQIESDIGDMSSMVHNLLTIAGLGASNDAHKETQIIDLNEIVQSAIVQLEPLAQRRFCDLSARCEQPEAFRGNRPALFQAVRNLVENAIKHSPEGATVTVTCGPGRSLAVDDSGRGLGRQDPHVLFEPFARGTSSAEGSGLGLAVVKAAVDLHRGSIEVGRSALGGARFVLHLNSLEPASSPSP
jgi:two-component system, OmpR family, sensor histidine kinase QseC